MHTVSVMVEGRSRHLVVYMLIVHAGVAAEACGGNEKNQLHGGAWLPEGGPAFIPVSNVADFHVVQQPSQRVAHQSNEEHGCVNFYAVLLLFETSQQCVIVFFLSAV